MGTVTFYPSPVVFNSTSDRHPRTQARMLRAETRIPFESLKVGFGPGTKLERVWGEGGWKKGEGNKKRGEERRNAASGAIRMSQVQRTEGISFD